MMIVNITICQSHDFCDYTVILSKPCQVLIWYIFLFLVDRNNLLINLKDKIFEPVVGSLPNLARMCP